MIGQQRVTSHLRRKHDLHVIWIHSRSICCLNSHTRRLVLARSGSPSRPLLLSLDECLGLICSLLGVQDRYLRYEGAMDQFGGRTVAGLPMNSPSFAILPPFFDSRKDAVEDMVNSAIKAVFPLAPDRMTKILEYCLASLAHHWPFLNEYKRFCCLVLVVSEQWCI